MAHQELFGPLIKRFSYFTGLDRPRITISLVTRFCNSNVIPYPDPGVRSLSEAKEISSCGSDE
jgi:hypothetical protein